MNNLDTLDQSLVETYCELGVTNTQTKERFSHQAIYGDDAYDHFVLALYFKQILQFNQLMEKTYVELDEIPRKEKVLFLYELFNYFKFNLTYFEIGTTLFEFIDGIDLMDKLCGSKIKSKDTILYRGVEISELLKQAALRLHPDHNVQHFNDIKDIQSIDVFFDRIVSSYCFKNSKELADVMNKAKVSYVNLFVSKTMSFDVINDVGKVQTYFSLPSLLRHLTKPLYYLYGREDESNIQGFFLNCEEKELSAIMASFKSNFYLADFMKIKNVQVINAREMIKFNSEQIKILAKQHIRESYQDRLKDYQSVMEILAKPK